jgi:hypothetical protein
MSLFLRVFSVLLVVGLSQVTPVRAQQVGQYMQLFYYGPQAGLITGPIGRFSPAFKGKAEIKLAQQDEYNKQFSPFPIPSLPTGKQQAESMVTDMESGETVVTVNGKRLSSAEAEKYRKDQRAREKASQDAYLSKLSQYAEAVTSEISKSLNEAAADGWEVVQMASLPNSGLVYLMRKTK